MFRGCLRRQPLFAGKVPVYPARSFAARVQTKRLCSSVSASLYVHFLAPWRLCGNRFSNVQKSNHKGHQVFHKVHEVLLCVLRKQLGGLCGYDYLSPIADPPQRRQAAKPDQEMIRIRRRTLTPEIPSFARRIGHTKRHAGRSVASHGIHLHKRYFSLRRFHMRRVQTVYTDAAIRQRRSGEVRTEKIRKKTCNRFSKRRK